jgi:hypothetical protein
MFAKHNWQSKRKSRAISDPAFNFIYILNLTSYSAGLPCLSLLTGNRHKSAGNPLPFGDGMQGDERDKDWCLPDIFLICGV